MNPSLLRYWRAALVSLLLAAALGGAVAFAWRLLTSPFHGSSTTAKLAIAGLTLLGVVVTTLVSVIGLLFKQSIDRRTMEISQAEHGRQVMETALQTVRLMTLDNGSPAPTTQISAALLVLASLGEVTMAIHLAAEMWPRDHVTSSTATQLVDFALAEKDPSLHRDAAMLLYNNFARLDMNGNQYEWPNSLDHWPTDLDDEARRTLVLALAEWMRGNQSRHADDLRIKLLRQAQQLDKVTEIRELATRAVSDWPALPS
jgi:hypothetical protein